MSEFAVNVQSVLKSAPSTCSALRLPTLVVLVTTMGDVPVEIVDVNRVADNVPVRIEESAVTESVPDHLVLIFKPIFVSVPTEERVGAFAVIALVEFKLFTAPPVGVNQMILLPLASLT